MQDKIGISPGAGHSIVAGEAVISVDVLKGNRVFNAFTDTFYCSQHVFVSKGYCFQWCHNSVYMLSPLIIFLKKSKDYKNLHLVIFCIFCFTIYIILNNILFKISALCTGNLKLDTIPMKRKCCYYEHAYGRNILGIIITT